MEKIQPLAELLCLVVPFDAQALSRIKLPETLFERPYGLFLLFIGGSLDNDYGHRRSPTLEANPSFRAFHNMVAGFLTRVVRRGRDNLMISFAVVFWPDTLRSVDLSAAAKPAPSAYDRFSRPKLKTQPLRNR
jgi:hypothetical protein